MSIATAITNLQGKIANAYTAIENKGGTLPETQNAENLSATIDAIPSGGSSSKFGATIDEVFQTTTTGDETTLNLFGGVTNLNFTDVTSFDNKFAGLFKGSTSLTSVSFPALKMISINNPFDETFQNCTKLASISFPELSNITGTASGFRSVFSGCTSLSSISFPKLTVISSTAAGQVTNGLCGYLFNGCTSLSSISFPALSYINGTGALGLSFQNCTSLTSVSFPELSSVRGYNILNSAFAKCTNLTSVSFPKLEVTAGALAFTSTFGNNTNRTGVTTVSFPELTSIFSIDTNASRATFYNNNLITRFDFPKLTVIAAASSGTGVDGMYLFNNCTNLVEIHFGAENQSIIEGSAGYATKWGAPNSNCQIYFDL